MATNTSRRYGARRNASRQLPTASPLAEPLASRSAPLPRPPWSPQQLERRRHRALDVVVGRLEPEHEQRVRAVAGAGHLGLAGVDQAAVRRVQPGLRQRPDRLRPGRELGEPDRGRGATGRARADPHPRLGDHPERAFRADQHPVGRDAGAGAGQPARLPHAARRHRPHRLDEVVDVGVERREVAAGAGRDPAAERRELKRLREVAERQPVRAELLLEAAARWRRPGSAPTATRGRPRARGRAPSGRSSPRPRSPRTPAASTPPTTLVPPPNGITAAPADSAHSSVGLHLALVARLGDDVGRVIEAAAERAHDVAVRAAVGVQRALVVVGGADRRERARAAPAAAAAATPPTAAPAARARRPEAQAARSGTRPRRAAPPARAARPRSPIPSA